jgi:ATP-dependent RNA helicase DDX3X
MHILPECTGLTLVFVERKRSADHLEHYLREQGVNSTSIHGDRSQEEREHALAMFRCGRCPVLVATDVAARGLDIPNVMDVINFDMPNSIDDYVHRIGRTGRCGNTGTATTFVNQKNKSVAKDLHDKLSEAGAVVPNWLLSLMDMGSRSYARGGRSGGGAPDKFGGRDIRSQDAIRAGAKKSQSRDNGGGGKSGGAWPSMKASSSQWPSGQSGSNKGGSYGASTDAW